ncbi:unnamed protein product [Rotaria sp. Silwood1]|nr:unnamed protein product [Rotaria sp. Silwood1]
MEKVLFNKCNAYKSLPNVLYSSKSNQIIQIHRSKSLPSCLKFLYEKYQYNKKLSILKRINIKKNSIERNNYHPTIGELLGDDDLFHYHYHKQYNTSRFKRQRHHYRSYYRSSHIHHHYRKHHHKIKEFQYQSSRLSCSCNKSTSEIKNQIYLYPTTTYNYTPIPTYCYYYYYSNMSSYYPYFISDCYKIFYQKERYYENINI